MLKIVVFDGGFGGELFADYLEETLPVVEVIRVIDWRNADKLQKNSRTARRAARAALRPYIGKVDLVVFANVLLSETSLKYFRRKYRRQKFLGLGLSHPGTFKRRSLILTTKPVAHTISYQSYVLRLKHRSNTLCLDTWLPMIDDGELSYAQIKTKLNNYCERKGFRPDEIILACSHFRDIEPQLRRLTNFNTRIYDGFNDTTSQICRTLRLKGSMMKQKGRRRRKRATPSGTDSLVLASAD